MKEVQFVAFSTCAGRFYVYDRSIHTLIEVNEQEYRELCRIQSGELSSELSSVVACFQKQGALLPTDIIQIMHPMDPYLEYLANHRMSQLILQVTQQCNLRCSYCPYSGLYPNQRQHSHLRMPEEIALQAIDFYLDHSRDSQKLTIAFYGGEPLLEFSLIQKCVEYVSSRVEGKEIVYVMTTNGTLIKGDVARFLAENRFNLSISLDGSKKEHDINRKFASGEGSFDVVMENVRRFIKDYPDYSDQISFTTTINPRMDLSCAMEFFTTDQIMNDHYIIFNSINEVGLPKSWDFDERSKWLRRYEHMKMLFMLAGKLDEKYVSRLVLASAEQYRSKARQLHNHMRLPSVAHPGGPCVPGVKRLFVTTDGSFYPCEKVSEQTDYFRIGSIEKGFDFKKMRQMLNNAVLISESCMKCWNIQNCAICSGRIDFEDQSDLTREKRLSPCTNEKAQCLSELYEIAVLNEFGMEISIGRENNDAE